MLSQPSNNFKIGNKSCDALKAFHDIRESSAGLPEMSLDEINAEIAAARAERKQISSEILKNM